MTVDQFGQLRIPASATSALLDNSINPAADYIVAVEVEDSGGSIAIRHVLLDAVNSSNSPPVIAPIGNRVVQVNNTVSFTVSATDPNAADIVTLAATGLPTGASKLRSSKVLRTPVCRIN